MLGGIVLAFSIVLETGSKPLPFVENEIIIRFKERVSKREMGDLHSSLSSEVLREFGIIKGLHLVRVKGDVREIIKKYRENPLVEYAEPNYIYETLAIPNDPYFRDLWGLHSSSNYDIDAPEAWDLERGGDTVVAVIDTGVDYTHPDLFQNIWTNPGETPGNRYDDDENGIPDDYHGANILCFDPYFSTPSCVPGDPMDDNGHGTHVSGTIGATGNNGIGVVGVNWNVKIMPVKFLSSEGWGTLAGAIMALEYVLNMKKRGINVIATNNSWGGIFFSHALRDAIRSHLQEGILCIAAAGNESADADTSPLYPAGYDLLNVISVAAINSSGNLAWFSNYGKRRVHVAAPGISILSTVPQNSYTTYSGTSMATPHVTGLSALLKSYNPSLEWHEIKNLILTGGKELPSLKGKTLTGKLISAGGSLTCAEKSLFSVKSPMESEAYLLSRIPVEVMNVECERPAGEVKVFTPEGEEIRLRDNGEYPDIKSGDGVYSGIYIPPSAGVKNLVFSNGSTSFTMDIKVGDGFYEFNDSVEFQWIDATSGGTSHTLCDDCILPITPPFPVYLYGIPFNTIYVSDNGYITFFNTWLSFFWNDTIPTSFIRGPALFPYWEDLLPAGNAIYTKVVGSPPFRRFVVEWKDLRHWVLCYFGFCDGVTFEVIFYEEEPGKVLFSYYDTSFMIYWIPYWGYPSIGIQLSPEYGQLFSYGEGPLSYTSIEATLHPSGNVPVLEVEPMELWFDGTFSAYPERKKISITNAGTADLTITGIQPPSSEEFVLLSSPSTPFILKPGERAELELTYMPKDGGKDGDSIVISSNAGTKTVTLYGWAPPFPDIKVSPLSIDFGSIMAGEYAEGVFMVYNTGFTPLTINSIILPDGFSLSYPPPFPFQMNKGGQYIFTIRFQPSEDRIYAGNMIVLSNDPDESAVSIFLSGIGIMRAEMEIESDLLNFGDVEVGDKKELPLLIFNRGNAELSLEISSVPENFEVLHLQPILFPGEATTIVVEFTPSEEKEYIESLTIISSDPLKPQKSILLIGKGIKRHPRISVSPSFINFGEVEKGETSVEKLRIKNSGDAPLSITTIALPEGYFFPSPPSFPVSITPGEEISLNVAFSPEEEGIYSGSMVINSNDEENPQISIPLIGAGVKREEGGCGCTTAPASPAGTFLLMAITALLLKKLKNFIEFMKPCDSF